MNGTKNKIIVILGPTASGKSDAAIKLAKEFNGEIISADSRQIYRGMDIGTGKVEKDFSVDQSTVISHPDAYFSEGIPHYAIDIVDPKEDFNVSDFKKYSQEKIEEILSHGKIPIICGGTGFWISALVDNVDFPQVPPNLELRKKLEKETLENLLKQLEKMDSERMKTVDSKNKFRIIRAIEICQSMGKVPKVKNNPSLYDFVQIGVKMDKKILQERIQKRLDDRFEIGMIKEVDNLNKKKISWERLEAFGLEYRNIAQFLQKKVSEKEMREKLYFDIIHYAKRQMTWFKKDKRIIWLENYTDIKNKVTDYLK